MEGSRIEKGRFKTFYESYRGETNAAVLTIASVVIGIISLFSDSPNASLIVIILLILIVNVLLLTIIFNLKRFFRERFRQLRNSFDEERGLLRNNFEEIVEHQRIRLERADRIIDEYFGIPWRQNQYFTRKQHFAEEKRRLAEVLAKKLLPYLIEIIEQAYPDLDQLNIFLDSGTTITPVFRHLVRTGIPLKGRATFEIYTNNLAGIDEVHKMYGEAEPKLRDRNFNLISGRPLNPYRATTGKAAELFLANLWKDQAASGKQHVNLSILTSNWFLAGRDLHELQICARGPGHYRFKEYLMLHSDYIIIVSPLGKILRLGDVGELEDLVPEGYHIYEKDAYQSRPLDADRKARTYLLTSYRPPNSISPLKLLSYLLQQVGRRNESRNYRLFENNPTFDPYEPESNKHLAVLTDIPHEYIRDNFEKAYQYPLPP